MGENPIHSIGNPPFAAKHHEGMTELSLQMGIWPSKMVGSSLQNAVWSKNHGGMVGIGMYVYICIYVYLCICVYVYMCMCVCVYVCMCVCVYMCIGI